MSFQKRSGSILKRGCVHEVSGLFFKKNSKVKHIVNVGVLLRNTVSVLNVVIAVKCLTVGRYVVLCFRLIEVGKTMLADIM